MSIISDFKDFVVKGNVIDLAVAFVMGAAFNAVVTALVTDIVTPIIGIPGHVNFATFVVYGPNGSQFLVGAFINSLIAFISIAIAVFFFIIKPVSKLQSLKKTQPPSATTKICPYCISTIDKSATRCPNCTSRLKAA